MNPERIIIGQLINDHSVYYSAQPKSMDFTDPRARKCFEAIERLILNDRVPDLPTVASEQTALSPSELSEALDSAPSSANADYYVSRARETARKARIKSLAPWITDKIDAISSDDAIEHISQVITDVQTAKSDYETKPVSDSIMDYVNQVETRYNSKGQIPGIATGFGELDQMILGLQKQRYIVIGARPSAGKSAAAVNMVKNIGLRGVPVGLFSLETDKTQIINRMVSDVGNIDSQSLMTGLIGRRDFDRMTEAVDRLHEAPIYIYDKPNASLQEIQAEARRMVRQWGVQAIFLDYIGLVQCHGEKEYERVTTASMALKSLWRSLDVPGVVLSQVHRHDHRRPTKSNLKGSGQIEQDADVVMLIHHDESEGALWIVDKNRDGPTGDIEMSFDTQHVRFFERWS